MKYLAHVPVEQYGFISVEVEGGPEDVVEAYKAVKRQMEGNAGLSLKEWNAWLDGYLTGKAGSVEDWERMSPEQKHIINEIKKCKKRNEGLRVRPDQGRDKLDGD